jgi:hypothetical protein
MLWWSWHFEGQCGARYETKLPRAWLVKNQVGKPTPKNQILKMEVICSYLFNTDWYSKPQTLIKCDPGTFFGATVARSVARLLWNVVHCIAWAVRQFCPWPRNPFWRCWSCTLPRQNVDFEWSWNINFAFEKLAAILSWHLFHRLIFQNLEPVVLPKGQKQKMYPLDLPPVI